MWVSIYGGPMRIWANKIADLGESCFDVLVPSNARVGKLGLPCMRHTAERQQAVLECCLENCCHSSAVNFRGEVRRNPWGFCSCFGLSAPSSALCAVKSLRAEGAEGSGAVTASTQRLSVLRPWTVLRKGRETKPPAHLWRAAFSAWPRQGVTPGAAQRPWACVST